MISPVLDRMDSERSHVMAREALHMAEMNPVTLRLLELFADQHSRFSDERLQITAGGVSFENPVMVGAGWDKKGRAVESLYRLGFSGVEVGTVLAYGQPGNDKPRQFMIGPGVALNRLGFNAPPAQEVRENLQRYRSSKAVIGISVGKNKEVEHDTPKMHAIVVRELFDVADYFTFNPSSPNTPGLRQLQEKGLLTDNIQAILETMDSCGERKPLFIKIAPDLTNEATSDVVQVALDFGLAGIIATNTTIDEEIKKKYGVEGQMGGISGNDPDFRRMATEKIAHIFRETGGTMDIIGVGGINNVETALEKIQAGARVVQVVTGIRGEGTALPGRINRGLVSWMGNEGIQNISEAVGSKTS